MEKPEADRARESLMELWASVDMPKSDDFEKHLRQVPDSFALGLAEAVEGRLKDAPF